MSFIVSFRCIRENEEGIYLQSLIIKIITARTKFLENKAHFFNFNNNFFNKYFFN